MATGQQDVATHGAGNDRLEVLIVDNGFGDSLTAREGN
jgi:hypothetical protein